MKIYFLRHGIAVEPGEWTGTDYDRPLTRDGIERMEREAKGIAELALDVGAIVTSPLLRAKQTAEIVADRLKKRDDMFEDDRLAGGFGVGPLSEILAEHSRAESIMLVGHEPTMSATLGSLVGNARVEMKKAALAGVSVQDSSPHNGMLIFLLPPKILAALGKR